MTRQNALWNCKNPYQGDERKILCICSAGLLRSPTIAHVLNKRDYNTRAAGMYDYARVKVDEVLIEWADIIVFAEEDHYDSFVAKYGIPKKEFFVLGLPDVYGYKDANLIRIVEEKLGEIGLV